MNASASITDASDNVPSATTKKSHLVEMQALTLTEMEIHCKTLAQQSAFACAQADAAHAQAKAARVVAMNLTARTFCMQVGIKKMQHNHDDRILFVVPHRKDMETEEFRNFLETHGTDVSIDAGFKERTTIHIKLNKGLGVFDFFMTFLQIVPGAMPVLDF